MCLLRELSKVVRTRKRGDYHQNFPLIDLIQVVFVLLRFPIKFYPDEMGVKFEPKSLVRFTEFAVRLAPNMIVLYLL